MKHRLNGEIQKLPNPYNGVNNPHLLSAEQLRGFDIEAFEEIYPDLGENQRHTKEYVVDEEAFTITYGEEDVVYDIEAIYTQKENELHEVVKDISNELSLAERRYAIRGEDLPDNLVQFRAGLLIKEQEEKGEIRAHYESGDAQLLLAYQARTDEAQGIINQIKQL